MYIAPNYNSRPVQPAFTGKVDILTPNQYEKYLEKIETSDKFGLTKMMKTCDWVIERRKIVSKSVIEKCYQDVEQAILANKPQEELSKLFDILNIFLEKFAPYRK